MNWKQQQKEMLKALQQQQEAKSSIFTIPVIWYGVFGANVLTESKPRPTSTEPSARLTELVGWRQWRLRGGKLWSLSVDCCWEGPTLSVGKPALNGEERIQTALRQATFFPDPDSSIGIMAYKKSSSLNCCEDPSFVYGSVYLWGSVAEHTNGYRAERATIRSLLVHSEAADQIESLQARYQPEALGIYRTFVEQLEAL